MVHGIDDNSCLTFEFYDHLKKLYFVNKLRFSKKSNQHTKKGTKKPSTLPKPTAVLILC